MKVFSSLAQFCRRIEMLYAIREYYASLRYHMQMHTGVLHIVGVEVQMTGSSVSVDVSSYAHVSVLSSQTTPVQDTLQATFLESVMTPAAPSTPAIPVAPTAPLAPLKPI